MNGLDDTSIIYSHVLYTNNCVHIANEKAITLVQILLSTMFSKKFNIPECPHNLRAKHLQTNNSSVHTIIVNVFS